VNLGAQHLKARMDVARPQDHAVLRGAHPKAPRQRDGRRLPFRAQPLEKPCP
jgi:hypothetical protein